ncbi:MAG TPA: FxLYD domain-containing protein [Candidatus Binatia bacterium]|nr:FxLYD domain-containing protein [Candidatus Binatia bacterium]
MTARVLTAVGLVAVVAAIALSLAREERFVVEEPRLEREGGGVRVAGTVHNRGEAAARVEVEVAVVGEDGRLGEKETVELRDVGADARVPFASRVHPGDVKSYSIHVNEGKNPYGN